MYYLEIFLEDNTVEYFCSKNIQLLLKAVENIKNWSISDRAREFPAEDYLVFEITEKCSSSKIVN